MPKPTRVRVQFELTREEAEALLRHTQATAQRQAVGGGGGWPAVALYVATERALARYDARTKWEVGDAGGV